MTRPELAAAARATLNAVRGICKKYARCDSGCPFEAFCGVRAPSGIRPDEVDHIADMIALKAEKEDLKQ